MKRRLVIFQAGGPTAVVNTTLAGILEQCGRTFGQIWGLAHGFENPAPSQWIDLSSLIGKSSTVLQRRATLARTPGAMLGASRKRVSTSVLRLMVESLREQKITDLIGIGGNGTMQTLHMLAEVAHDAKSDLRIAGAPKTVDNDIPGVAFAPGFGSAARFVALAVRDFDCDFRAMQTFDDVTILETMGRDTGWLAAASVLLQQHRGTGPHIVLVPERPVDERHFLDQVSRLHDAVGRVFVVTNEVLLDRAGNTLGAEFQDGPTDSLGRKLYSLSTGTAHYLAGQIRNHLNLQVRCLRPGNLGRAFSTCVSPVDYSMAHQAGCEAVKLLQHSDRSARMITIDSKFRFGSQPALSGTGRRSLPKRYLTRTEVPGISAAYRREVASVIGPVEPLFDGLGFAR